jgi:ribosomal-protein-alanine N-acetyltransferase
MPKRTIPHPILTTPRLRLRQFHAGDVEGMHACLADAVAMRFWNHLPHRKLTETQRAVHRMIECTPTYYRFWAVADAQTDRCLGMVNYHDGRLRQRRATIGYIIDPTRQRQGVATEAVSAMVDFCFAELRLHRLEALIHPDNTASRALAEKLGFRCEGTLREHLRVGESWRDDMLYALLANEHPPRQAP